MPHFMKTCRRGHHRNVSCSEEDAKFVLASCPDCEAQDAQHSALAEAVATAVEKMLLRHGVIPVDGPTPSQAQGLAEAWHYPTGPCGRMKPQSEWTEGELARARDLQRMKQR